MALTTVLIGGVPTVIDLNRSSRVITGNFQSYTKNPYSAYTGMWGHYLPQNNTLVADSAMRVYPGRFPAATVFTWDVTRDPDWSGVNGYLHLSWGNYDGSPGVITSNQVKNITALTVDIDWAFTGDAASGLLSECWLTPVATPTGEINRDFEVAFFPKLSAGSVGYVQSLPAVGGGSFTDSAGIAWSVCEGVSGTDEPYFIAYRPGYVEFRGPLPYRDYFAFLTAAGKISGNEWFNGLAFGVEPYSGTGSLTVSKFAPTYA